MAYCCEVFPKIARSFKWMTANDRTIYLLPYIEKGSDLYKVNNCPSCGKYIREIDISETEFKKLL